MCWRGLREGEIGVWAVLGSSDEAYLCINVIKLSKTYQRVPAINQSCVGMLRGFCPLSEVP